MAAPWQALYRAEREHVLLARLRWCTVFASVGAALLIIQSLLLPGPELSLRIQVALFYASASAGTCLLTYWQPAHRRSAALALAYVLMLITLMSRHYVGIMQDAGVAPAGFVSVMVGVTVLLPWGGWPQAMIGTGCLIGYGWVLGHTPGSPDVGAISLLTTLFVVTVAAAQLIERFRAHSFERAWQQEQLVSLARELAARVESSEVVAKVVGHAIHLVPAGICLLGMRDDARQLFRIEVVVGPSAAANQWLVGLDIPDGYAPLRQIAATGMLVLPDDDPQSPLAGVLGSQHVQRGLYVAMRCGGDVVGILAFMRTDDTPFAPSERLLARAIADQAALALRNARLVADLRLANQLKSEFVSTMSHELRTPLHVILGYAEMIEDPNADPHEQQESVQHIKRAGRSLLELIENTLEIGKIEAGKEAARIEAIWLPDFWTELGQACELMRRPHDVVLEWSWNPPPVSIHTDPRKLAVVLRNLISNALKFTEQGRVLAEVRTEPETLVLRVTDTGVGISPQDQETIFEMFRQADQSDTRRFGGSGLGLYIVQRFVQQLGGAIAVESTQGHGSTFIIRLPTTAPVRVAA